MTKDLAPYLMNIHVYVPLFHKLKPILDPPCNYGPSLWWYCGWHHYNLWIVSAELYIKKNNLLGVFNITETNIEQHISISVYILTKSSFFDICTTFTMNCFLRHVTTLPWSSSSFFWVLRTLLQNLGMSNLHFFWISGFSL